MSSLQCCFFHHFASLFVQLYLLSSVLFPGNKIHFHLKHLLFLQRYTYLYCSSDVLIFFVFFVMFIFFFIFFIIFFHLVSSYLLIFFVLLLRLIFFFIL